MQESRFFSNIAPRSAHVPASLPTNIKPYAMELYFVRHTSVAVPPGVCYGRTDVPLRDTFGQEAADVRARLAELLPAGTAFDHVYTSPLSRCTRLAASCGHPDAERDDRLLELDFGAWEMRAYDDIDDPRLEEWYADYLNVAPTRGESFAMQRQRVAHFLDEVRRRPWQRVGVFTHAGVVLCAELYAGHFGCDGMFGHLTPYGGVVRIDL